MRNRFFFIILTTLVLGALGFNAITSYFFRNQRIHLIDQQIKDSARGLLESKEFLEAAADSAQLEETISKVLGGERIGKVFIVRDLNGTILYQSFNASLLKTELPTSPDWIAVRADDQYVRIHNAPLGKNKILQVGLVLDMNFVNWRIINSRTLLFISGLFVAIFALSALLTLVLLSPIRLLNMHLSRATSNLSNLKDVDPLPKKLMRYTAGFWSRSDEFSDLVNTMQRLIDRINLNYKLTRSWTLQLAHELKTPLVVIRAETETQKKSLPPVYAETILDEVDLTSETITQFLSWAELENAQLHSQAQDQIHSPLRNSLHVMRLGAVVQNAITRLDKLTPSRVELRIDSDFSVAANPGHLDQLVTNLLTNALKFSPSASPVIARIGDSRLTIADQGPGISPEVLERLGQPFNVGFSKSNSILKGTGLGLAWVSTVAKLYGWKVHLQTGSSGTSISVEFTELD